MGLFFKVEDDGKGVQTSVKEEKTAAIPVQTQVPPVSPVPSMAQEDAAIKQQLAEALEQANQPGYDYFEMAKAVEAQASIIPSEALRFQSTFAAISSMGITPEKLISSAEFYLSILKKKDGEFNKTVEDHVAKAVTAREEEAKKFDADMQIKAEQIKKLTDEINAMQQQKTTIVNEISTTRGRIEQVRNNFNVTMKIFVDKINSDIGKIKTYLIKQ
jgi:hypothetical protein